MANVSGLVLIVVFYGILAGLYQDASVDLFALLAIAGASPSSPPPETKVLKVFKVVTGNHTI